MSMSPAPRDEYVPVDYLHVRSGSLFRLAWAVAGILCWPLLVPLSLVSRLSTFAFVSCSELLSGVPLFVGLVLRYEFYRLTLEYCGRNVLFGFGTILNDRRIRIGDNVLIGRYNVIHHCDFGDYSMTGEHSVFLSGSRQHNFDRADVPIYLQGGHRKHIVVGSDVWVGAHCVVADDVGSGSIVTAGSTVVRPVPSCAVAIGNPARTLPRFRHGAS